MSQQQLLELPPNQTLAQLQSLLNDRIRDLDVIFQKLMANPADGDLDMANFLIHNLADPVSDQDAVNLRTLKRFGGATTPTPAPVASPGLDAYAIVFTDSLIAHTGDLVPGYVVGANREGSTQEVWVYARGAPLADFTFNLTVNGTNILSVDMTLAAGSIGPVFGTPSAVSLTHGDVVLPVITNGSSAGGVSIGLVVKR